MTRHFIPPEAYRRRAEHIAAEADQRDAKRLRRLGERIGQAKAKARPEATGTRQAMERAMRAQRP